VAPPANADQESRYRAGDFGTAGKDSKKSGRSQHERETQAIVVTPQPVEDLAIASVQMKILRQLIRGRISGKTGVALPRLIGQVVGGHIVRNLLIEQLRKGDILMVTRLDRLARSSSELLRIAERLTEKSAGLQSLDEPWADTTSPSRSAPLPGPSTSTRRRSTASSRDRGLMLLFCSSQPHRPNSVLGRWKGRTDSVSGDANCHITPSLSTSSRTSCFTRRSRAMKLESVRSRG
jgi:Resolvase, N terminal domain